MEAWLLITETYYHLQRCHPVIDGNVNGDVSVKNTPPPPK